MNAHIGLTEAQSQAVAVILNQLLADEQVLYAKTRNYHWNYEGGNFMEMHKFYEGQYEALADMIDDLAERIRQLGHFAQGRLKDYVKAARLTEPAYTTEQDKQVQNLLDDHETLIRQLRQDIDVVDNEHKDAGTTDFLTGLMQQHEKMAWMLRAYLR
ncbi:MAG TPA: DNA starvation/stationary phase protection protein [Chitinophagaceae bacterium]|nr:DNA starvation/stationary phase protection protein [Chitinophagaceae bacterium]